jgi:hypothetical protein
MQISASPRIFVLAALPLLTKPDVVGNLLRHVKFFRGCWTFSEQITPRRAVLGRGARAVAVDLECEEYVDSLTKMEQPQAQLGFL